MTGANPTDGLRTRRTEPPAIRDYAEMLIQRVRFTDADGRKIGFDYGYIRRAVLRKFPIVLANGPHKGRPTKMPFKELQTYTCELNLAGVRLPFRPRRKEKKKRAPKARPILGTMAVREASDAMALPPASDAIRYARSRARKLGLPDPCPRADGRMKLGPRPWLRITPRDAAHAAYLQRKRTQAAARRAAARAREAVSGFEGLQPPAEAGLPVKSGPTHPPEAGLATGLPRPIADESRTDLCDGPEMVATGSRNY